MQTNLNLQKYLCPTALNTHSEASTSKTLRISDAKIVLIACFAFRTLEHLYSSKIDLDLWQFSLLLLGGFMYCSLLPLLNTSPKEIQIIRSFTSELKAKGYKFIDASETFRISTGLQQDYKDLLKIFKRLTQEYPLHSESLPKGTVIPDKYKYLFLRHIFNAGYSVKGNQVRSLTSIQNAQERVIEKNVFLKKLLLSTLQALPGYNFHQNYQVHVMLTSHSESTPSLIPHQVGFGGWQAVYTIDYSPSGISGGECQVMDCQGNSHVILEQRLLDTILSGYIVDDTRYHHAATEIKIDKDSGAHRWVAIFRFYCFGAPQNSSVCTHEKQMPQTSAFEVQALEHIESESNS